KLGVWALKVYVPEASGPLTSVVGRGTHWPLTWWSRRMSAVLLPMASSSPWVTLKVTVAAETPPAPRLVLMSSTFMAAKLVAPPASGVATWSVMWARLLPSGELTALWVGSLGRYSLTLTCTLEPAWPAVMSTALTCWSLRTFWRIVLRTCALEVMAWRAASFWSRAPTAAVLWESASRTAQLVVTWLMRVLAAPLSWSREVRAAGLEATVAVSCALEPSWLTTALRTASFWRAALAPRPEPRMALRASALERMAWRASALARRVWSAAGAVASCWSWAGSLSVAVSVAGLEMRLLMTESGMTDAVSRGAEVGWPMTMVADWPAARLPTPPPAVMAPVLPVEEGTVAQ